MLKVIRKHWFFVGLLAVVYIGVTFPEAGHALKPWINYLVFLSMLLIGLRLDFSEVKQSFSNVTAIAICLLSSYVAMPLLCLLLGNIFFRHDLALFAGIIMAGAVPTTQASSVIWTDLAKANKGLALVLMGVSNTIGVFLSPFLLLLLLGATVELPVVDMIVTLFFYILFPVSLGQGIKHITGTLPRGLQDASRTVNIAIVWAAVLTALSSGDLLSLPLGTVITAVVIQYFTISLLSFFSSRHFGLSIDDSLAVMFCSSQVTLTVATVIGFSYFETKSIIYIVVYHLFQQVMGQVTANFVEELRRRG